MIHRIKNLVITVLMLCAQNLAAQYFPEKVPKKAMALYQQGLEKANDGDFKTGIRLLDNAIKIAELQQSACFACQSQLHSLRRQTCYSLFFCAFLAAKTKKEM